MPCKKANHTHVWSTEGVLTIERCEKICGFCNKQFKHAWFVRRHVDTVHAGVQFPNLIVGGGWSGSPSGNRPFGDPDNRRRRRNASARRGNSHSPSPAGTSMTPSETSTGGFSPPEGDPGVVAAPVSAMGHLVPSLNLDLTAMAGDMPSSVISPSLGFDNFIFADMGFPETPAAIWSSPQKVRGDFQLIEGEMPVLEHHETAYEMANGLNVVVERLTSDGKLSHAEVVYILENYTASFKNGVFV